MLRFVSFKNKQFIFLISLYSEPIKTKRYLSQLQTKIVRKNNYIGYFLHSEIHREEKELNRVLPAIINDEGDQYWCKNDKFHRDEKDENGQDLPAIIYIDGRKEWYKNGKYYKDRLLFLII